MANRQKIQDGCIEKTSSPTAPTMLAWNAVPFPEMEVGA